MESKPDKQLIAIVRGIIGTVMSFIIALLVAQFLIGGVMPGNPDNQNAIKAFAIVLKPLEMIANALSFPVRMLLVPLSKAVHIDSWFPATDLGELMESVVNGVVGAIPPIISQLAPFQAMINFDFEYWFPGVLDWCLLLAIPLWSLLETLSFNVLDKADKVVDRGHRQQTENKMAAHFGVDEARRERKDAEKQQKAAPAPTRQEQENAAMGAMVSNLKSELSRMERKVKPLERQAQSDGLTGLRNRAYFDNAMRREIDNARDQSSTLALILMDIDNFKLLNDSMGHSVGDTVLRRVAEIVEQQVPVRGQATACRYGGEEFAIVVARTSIEASERLAQVICYEIATATFPEYPSLRVSASLGVFAADFTHPGTLGITAEDFIKRADAKMYESKQNGKNQVRLDALR